MRNCPNKITYEDPQPANRPVMAGTVIHRRLAGQVLGDHHLIDVVKQGVGDWCRVTLYFLGAAHPEAITPPKGAALVDAKSIGGSVALRYQIPADHPAEFRINGDPVQVQANTPELALLEGHNAFVAVRNGEHADIVLDWLRFHIRSQGLQGAVILDRAKPGYDNTFDAELQQGIHQLDAPCTIVVVRSDTPLGKTNLPAEAHPFCAPGAPGKDRMKIPKPDPWAAPLGALNWFEIAKDRFLAQARAVANVEAHDLLVREGDTVFDKAIAAKGGVATLIGQHCYPWRIRNAGSIHFGDHICTQFDADRGRKRWCIAPAKAPEGATWRLLRIGNAVPDPQQVNRFHRHMALRHPTDSVSTIVPKSSLVENKALRQQAKGTFGHKALRAPKVKLKQVPKGRGRRAIVTTMKNEGPFILEWLAYHRAIGFDDILVYTNDCTDGTDTMLDMLMDKGIVIHRDNKFQKMGLRPQHAALQMAEDEPVIQKAKWVTCIDVDEYVNIKVGDGTLDALFAAVPAANLISMTWRLFGNADVAAFEDRPITEQFDLCAHENTRKPHQAWGFKTLFTNNGIFRKLGVHRPKGLNPQLWDKIVWVNGSGQAMPRTMFRNGWRSTSATYGYDLVQLNHYAVRSAESFLVKRDRGRVNHVDRDQGLAYWFRMNNNVESDDSIDKNIHLMQHELAKLMADPEIAAAHRAAVSAHRAKIAELRDTPAYAEFYAKLTGDRLKKLARLHGHFGAHVYLAGPDALPDHITDKDPDGTWFFTVDPPEETKH
jgi:hypothetical protein